MDVTVVGSCNIDLIGYAARFPQPGETLQGSKFSMGHGGKGANQCVTVAKLGGKAAMVGKVGTDTFGEGYLKHFHSCGVDTRYCLSTSEASTGVAPAFVDESSGQNSIVIVPGANLWLTETDLKNALDVISRSKVIVCQLEIKPEVTLAALKLARKHNVKTILNPAPAIPLDKEFLENADIFCPNETEAEILTGHAVHSIEAAKSSCTTLQSMGCTSVIITLGHLGCVVSENPGGDIVHVPAPTVKAVDTTGAGDSFIGALAYFLATQPGLGLVRSCEKASVIASVSVQNIGTQLSYPTRAELPQELFSM